MKFSERFGFVNPEKELQVASMDDDLRVGLWNVMLDHYWFKVTPSAGGDLNGDLTPEGAEVVDLARKIWGAFFKNPLDSFRGNWNGNLKVIRDYFFNCQWYEVYNLLEFIVQADPHASYGEASFVALCNQTLEREKSAYRIEEKQLVRLGADGELTAQVGQSTEGTNVRGATGADAEISH